MKVYKHQQNPFSISWERKLTILAARPFEAQRTLTYLVSGLRTLASVETCVAAAQPCRCHIPTIRLLMYVLDMASAKILH